MSDPDVNSANFVRVDSGGTEWLEKKMIVWVCVVCCNA